MGRGCVLGLKKNMMKVDRDVGGQKYIAGSENSDATLDLRAHRGDVHASLNCSQTNGNELEPCTRAQ